MDTLLVVIQRMLEKQHDVTTSNSRHALNILVTDANKFDVIISDLNMPDVSGIDIYRYVSTHHPELAKHMIFTTGGSTSPLMYDFSSKMKNPCLEKPFSLSQIKKGY